jgi:hypothetical protein
MNAVKISTNRSCFGNNISIAPDSFCKNFTTGRKYDNCGNGENEDLFHMLVFGLTKKLNAFNYLDDLFAIQVTAYLVEKYRK